MYIRLQQTVAKISRMRARTYHCKVLQGGERVMSACNITNNAYAAINDKFFVAASSTLYLSMQYAPRFSQVELLRSVNFDLNSRIERLVAASNQDWKPWRF